MIREYSDHVCMCAVLCIQIIIEDIVHSALKTECQTNHTDTLTKRQRRGNHSTAKEPIKETKKWTRSNDTWMNCKCLSRNPESNWNIWCVRVILHTYPYRTHWLAASHVKAVYVCMSVCLCVYIKQRLCNILRRVHSLLLFKRLLIILFLVRCQCFGYRCLQEHYFTSVCYGMTSESRAVDSIQAHHRNYRDEVFYVDRRRYEIVWTVKIERFEYAFLTKF